MAQKSDDFNEFLKVITPSDEEKKLCAEEKKVRAEYMKAFQTESEVSQRYFDFLRSPDKDSKKLAELKKIWDEAAQKRKELSKKSRTLSKRYFSLLAESTKKLHDYSVKRQKDINEIVGHANDVISAGRKSLDILKTQTALIEPKRKIRDLLSIIVIILNQKNSESLKKKFNDKLSQISPLVNVKEENLADWYVAFETKIERLITLDNFEMIFTLFKNTLIECESLVCEEENGEFKVYLLDFMIQHIDTWHDSYLEQRLKNILKAHQIENKHQMGVLGLFVDLYENITAENYKSILSGLLT